MAKVEKNAKSEKKLKKSFVKEFKAELKRVSWPTPKQLINNTVAVITIVLIITAIVFVLDVIFDTMNKYGITKAQEFVKEKTSTSQTTEDTNKVENSSDVNSETITDNEAETESTEVVENSASDEANN